VLIPQETPPLYQNITNNNHTTFYNNNQATTCTLKIYDRPLRSREQEIETKTRRIIK
jgi:hypothetical protein